MLRLEEGVLLLPWPEPALCALANGERAPPCPPPRPVCANPSLGSLPGERGVAPHLSSTSALSFASGFESDRCLASGFESDRCLASGFESDRFLASGFESDRFLASGFESDRCLASGFESDRCLASSLASSECCFASGCLVSAGKGESSEMGGDWSQPSRPQSSRGSWWLSGTKTSTFWGRKGSSRHGYSSSSSCRHDTCTLQYNLCIMTPNYNRPSV